MITGELLLMFQASHIVPMGAFFHALESFSGMPLEEQKSLTRAFTRNAVAYSKFWTSCTDVEYWVTEQALEQVVHVAPPAQASKCVRSNHYCADIGLQDAILRSQNAVAQAIKVQGKWRETMGDINRRWPGKVKHTFLDL